MQNWRPLLFAYLSEIWQYRWQGLAMAWVVCVVGWLYVAFIPNTYQSAAEVYIDTHTLLRPLLRGLAITPNPNQEIRIMLRELLTHPTMQRIVRATNPKASSMSASQMQDAIRHFRKNVSLRNLHSDIYRIAYRDHDPAHAQSVAQTLVSVLIDSSLGGQRQDADQVGSFLDSQIAHYEQKLEAADQRRADFKTAHLEYFSNGGRAGDVVGAQSNVYKAENVLNEAIDRRDSLRAQLKKTSKTLDVNSPLPDIMDRTGTALNPRTQLAAAIAKLNMLRMRYTDNYPDVVQQKRLIAYLEKRRSSGMAGMQGISNPGYVVIMSKLADAESQVAVDRNRLKDAKKQLENAKKMTEKAISIQTQYQNLDRDYQVLHHNYETLTARRESANITQAAGDTQSSFVFRVISPPLKPDHPIAPKRLFLNAAVLFLGIGAGGGLALALGILSGKFMSMEQVKEAFELPILGAVTTVRTSADMVGAVRSNMIFITGSSLLLVSCLIILLLSNFEVVDGIGPLL